MRHLDDTSSVLKLLAIIQNVPNEAQIVLPFLILRIETIVNSARISVIFTVEIAVSRFDASLATPSSTAQSFFVFLSDFDWG